MEKSAKEIDEKILKSSVVIVDVEGTTTSISFVKDVLFPFATEKVAVFLAAKWEAEGVQEAVEGMRQQALQDVKDTVEGAVPIPDKEASKEEQIAGVAASLKWLISIDNKGSFMKKLSGLIWEEGYTAGDIKGHLYKDVQPCLESWRTLGKRVYVYSSGSVHAQKLLMKHSEVGDVSALFDGHFDTAVGNKQEVQSYVNIVKEIGCQADEALFLTDIVKEAAAAKEAGLNTVLLVREGNAPLTEEDQKAYSSVGSFEELKLHASSAKRKQEPAHEEELPPTKVAKTTEQELPSIDKTETIENGASCEKKQSDDEAMEVDAVEEKSEAESNGLLVKETEAEEAAVADSKMDETPDVEVKAVDTPVVEAVAEPEVEAMVESSVVDAEVDASAKPVLQVVAEPLVEVVAKSVLEAETKPVVEAEASQEVDPETKSAVEARANLAIEAEAKPAGEADAKPAVEAEAESAVEAEAEPVVETKDNPVTEVEPESKPVAETKPEEETIPVAEAKPEDTPVAETKPDPVVEEKPVQESKPEEKPTEEVVETKSEEKLVAEASQVAGAKECEVEQPKIVETEAVVADDCNQKTDIDQICKDKGQVPEGMETEAETIVDEKCESQDASVTEKPNIAEGTPALTEVAEKEESVVCAKTENGSQENVIEVAEEAKEVLTEKPVEVAVEAMEADEEKATDVEKKESATEDIDSKMDTDEIVSCKDVSVERIISGGEEYEIVRVGIENVDADLNEKLNKLLGEKGVALEKECDDILSKVDEMTNKSLKSTKSFIQKAMAEKESSNDDVCMEVESDKNMLDLEAPETSISMDEDKDKVCSLKNGNSKEDTKDETAPEGTPPVEEKSDSVPTEVKSPENNASDAAPVPAVEDKKPDAPTEPKEAVSPSTEKKTNGSQECVNGKNDEVNGQSVEESPAVEQKAQNGSSPDEEKEKTPEAEDRLKSTNGAAVEEVKAPEPTAEQIKLKNKSEETITEKNIEQVAET